jgi:mRNA interferase MazF
VIARGEIWWTDLGPPHGSAPAKLRPVVVISEDRYNNSRLRTAAVVVLTSTARLAALPGNVAVAAELSGLERESVVNVTQIATVDRDMLVDRVGQLPTWLMTQIDDGLRRALSL